MKYKEMYILFGGENKREGSINKIEGKQAEENDEYKLDPFIASGEAPMSEEIIDLVASDSEEEDQHDQKRNPSSANVEILNHPLDE